MGADSARRFYKGGRPRVSDAPVQPEHQEQSSTPRAHKKNVQRAMRKRAERTLAGEASDEVALLPAREAIDLLDSAREAAGLIDGLGSLRRLILHGGQGACDELVNAGALQAIVTALSAHGRSDAAVAALGCRVLTLLCRGEHTASIQQAAAEAGAFIAIVASMCHGSNATLAACAAMCALCTGVGAAARRNLARGAGAVEVLVALIHSCEKDEAPPVATVKTRSQLEAACRGALRSITRDSMHLQQAALDAGAHPQWLV